MSLQVQLGDVTYSLASARGWQLACAWAAQLPDEFEAVKKFCADYQCADTEKLHNQLSAAPRPVDADVAHTIADFLEHLAGGAPDESATVLM